MSTPVALNEPFTLQIETIGAKPTGDVEWSVRPAGVLEMKIPEIPGTPTCDCVAVKVGAAQVQARVATSEGPMNQTFEVIVVRKGMRLVFSTPLA